MMTSAPPLLSDLRGRKGKDPLLSKRILFVIVAALALCQIILASRHRSFPITSGINESPQFSDRPFVDLFVAIGSVPGEQNAALRLAARETFLKDLINHDTFHVTYRFFVDANASTTQEAHGLTKDTVEMDFPGGYAHFVDRAFWQMKYAVNHYNFRYLLQIDDDGYLCTHKLIDDLIHQAPKAAFFWGKYWCLDGFQQADENFMLFSRDIIDTFLVIQEYALRGRKTTFASLFGFWHRLMNITVWDDQDRIDAQQQYTTAYMHSTDRINVSDSVLREFCNRHIYAHHVTLPELIRKVHSLLPQSGIYGLDANNAPIHPTGGVCRGQPKFNDLLRPSRIKSTRGVGFPVLSQYAAMDLVKQKGTRKIIKKTNKRQSMRGVKRLEKGVKRSANERKRLAKEVKRSAKEARRAMKRGRISMK